MLFCSFYWWLGWLIRCYGDLTWKCWCYWWCNSCSGDVFDGGAVVLDDAVEIGEIIVVWATIYGCFALFVDVFVYAAYLIVD